MFCQVSLLQNVTTFFFNLQKFFYAIKYSEVWKNNLTCVNTSRCLFILRPRMTVIGAPYHEVLFLAHLFFYPDAIKNGSIINSTGFTTYHITLHSFKSAPLKVVQRNCSLKRTLLTAINNHNYLFFGNKEYQRVTLTPPPHTHTLFQKFPRTIFLHVYHEQQIFIVVSSWIKSDSEDYCSVHFSAAWRTENFIYYMGHSAGNFLGIFIALHKMPGNWVNLFPTRVSRK